MPDGSRQSSQRPEVSVLIVAYQSAEDILPCLESLFALTRDARIEAVLADNGRDKTAALVRERFPGVLVIEPGGNPGFPKAVNLAASKARGDKFMLLNPDARLLNDAVSILAAYLDAHPEAGAAGPLILDADGSRAPFCAREFPSLSGSCIRLLGLRRLFPKSRLIMRETLPDLDLSAPSNVPCLTGAALMIPAGVFRERGGLDERLPMYFEDMEFCAALADAGFERAFVPEARIAHAGGASSTASPVRTLLAALEKGQAPWLYFRRRRGAPVAAAFSAIVMACSLFRLAAAGAALALAYATKRPAAGFKRIAAEAVSLLSWSLSNKRTFAKRLDAWFRPGS